MVKATGDYQPPPGWVKFETLPPGAKFHNVERPGLPTQYIKLQSDTGTYAVNTDNGLPVTFDLDEFVYPVDNGWIAELACFGFKKDALQEKMAEGGHRAVVAYVMSNCEARQADHRWRTEIEKYFPHLAVMSFAGAKRTIEWLMEQVVKKDPFFELARLAMSFRGTHDQEERNKIAEQYRATWAKLKPLMKDDFPGMDELLPDEYMPKDYWKDNDDSKGNSAG